MEIEIMKLFEVMKEILLAITVASTNLAIDMISQETLDPTTFTSEIGTIYQLVQSYNEYDGDDFHYETLRKYENGYYLVYRCDDGIQADFFFGNDEVLKSFSLSAYHQEGAMCAEKGIDVGSMLAYNVFKYSLRSENYYDLMKLFSSWEPNMNVTLNDKNLGALKIKQDAKNHTITMHLPQKRKPIQNNPEIAGI